MGFGSYAGTAIIPTLSRIVLGVCFITAGYNKVFNQADFAGDDAASLINLGVIDAPPSVALDQPQLMIRPASFIQEADAEDVEAKGQDAVVEGEAEAEDLVQQAADKADEAVENLEEGGEDVVDAAAESVQDAAESVAETIDEATRDIADKLPDATIPDIELPETGAVHQARAMHHVTLMIERAGWPYPVWQARLAALTELIGGGLLILGLFSRVWGLGLSIAMAVAFYLTGLEPYFSTGIFQTAASDIPLFNRVFAQAGLFVLSLGIFLTGPGPLSLDRLFFGRQGDKTASAEPSFD